MSLAQRTALIGGCMALAAVHLYRRRRQRQLQPPATGENEEEVDVEALLRQHLPFIDWDEGEADLEAERAELLTEQLSRNEAFLGAEAQAALADMCVTVVGLGATGSHAAQLLARTGVGRLRLIDLAVVRPHSLRTSASPSPPTSAGPWRWCAMRCSRRCSGAARGGHRGARRGVGRSCYTRRARRARLHTGLPATPALAATAAALAAAPRHRRPRPGRPPALAACRRVASRVASRAASRAARSMAAAGCWCACLRRRGAARARWRTSGSLLTLTEPAPARTLPCPA